MKVRNLILAILTISISYSAFSAIELSDFVGVTDHIYLSSADFKSSNSKDRRFRSRRVSYFFENHFDYSSEGYISIPPNRAAAKMPGYPRRALEKKHTFGHKESFSASVKLALFGSEITAGPKITFNREYSAVTNIVAKSMRPLLVRNGKLDHSKKLRVTCKVTGAASHEIDASSGLKVFGVGADASAKSNHQVSVSLESTPFYVPKENNAGQETSYKNVTNWCEKVFFKLNKDSIDEELKLAASELVYKSGRDQCINDQDCDEWFSGQNSRSNYQYNQSNISDSTPRCAPKEVDGQSFGVCVLKKSEGQSCSSRAKSWQMNSCDEGLKCVVTRPKTFYSSEVASCK